MGIFNKSTSVGAPEFLIAGLGNPGSQYERTRHNAGFMTADLLAKKYDVKINKLRFKSLCGDCVISGKRCLIIKPTTFMNLSGQAITEAMRFYKLPPENVIVIFDDISLDAGRLRIRKKGSDGGHNGMKNIIYLSGSDCFPRIKIGVGKKPHPDYDLKDWVLSVPSGDDLNAMLSASEKACDAIELMLEGKTDDAMNRFN